MPTEESVDQSFESILTQEKPVKEKKSLTLGKFKIRKGRALLWGSSLFAGLILLFILVSFLSKLISQSGPFPTPAPTPTPLEERITSPSAYATDSAILKIEAELKAMEEKLLSTDLKETTLNPPVLDMDVKF